MVAVNVGNSMQKKGHFKIPNPIFMNYFLLWLKNFGLDTFPTGCVLT